MIRGHSLASGSNYLEVNWTQPRFLPEWYQATHRYICTMKATSEFNYKMKNYVITNHHYLSSGTTSFRLSNLCVRSTWTLLLKAVYNLAGIDSGISITRPKLDIATSKRNSALGDLVIITLGNFMFII